MLSVTKIASYFCLRFLHDFGYKIDEMKLHKLLYLTQRECLVMYDTPVFGEVFEAWKYGPVVPEVRYLYKEKLLDQQVYDKDLSPFFDAIDKVFVSYAHQNSWSLSSITHGEIAWQNAYEKSKDSVLHCAIISTEDMRKDASRIRLRRFLLR